MLRVAKSARAALPTQRWPWMLLVALVLAAAVAKPRAPQPKPARLAQGQAAWQFLRAILRGEYVTAYGRLAPEVRRAVSLQRFEEAARPLWKRGQRRGQEIELYKLGVRLGAGNSSRLFYAFTFSADSAAVPPPGALEVTFRDTAARAVLGFGWRPGPRVAPKASRGPAGPGGPRR